MSPHKLVRLALKSGLVLSHDSAECYIRDGVYRKQIERFAALVAAAEREECAKAAEAYIDPDWPSDDMSVQAQNIAATIRAREAA